MKNLPSRKDRRRQRGKTDRGIKEGRKKKYDLSREIWIQTEKKGMQEARTAGEEWPTEGRERGPVSRKVIDRLITTVVESSFVRVMDLKWPTDDPMTSHGP